MSMNKIKNTSKVFIRHIIRLFWGGTLEVGTLIGTLEVIVHTLFWSIGYDWKIGSSGHVAFWSLWLYTCIVVRITRKTNH